MDFVQFELPQTLGESLAWATALATFLIGLGVLAVPRAFMGIVGLSATGPGGVSEVRAVVGGAFTGLGLACLLLSPQPLLYLALGLVFAFAVLGRLVSFLADRSFSPFTVAATLAEALGAALPLAYVFGIVA